MNNKKPIFKNIGLHYFQYLISYIVILSIPLVILSLYFSSRFITQFHQEVYKTVDMELEQISIRIDEKISQMSEASNRLSIENVFFNTKKAKEPYELLPMMNYLSIISTANDFYEDIFLNLNSCDYMISASTTHQKDLFFEYNFPDKEEAMDIFSNLNTGLGWKGRLASGDELNYIYSGYVFFVLPVYSDLRTEGTIIFKVPKQAFSAMISNRLNSYDTGILITDEDGNLIYENIDNLMAMITSEQKEYTIRSVSSDKSGLKYYAVIPNSQPMFSSIKDIGREYMSTVVIILVLGIAVIILLQRINYAPIRNLNTIAKNLLPDDDTSNEFKGITNAIDYLSTENTNLQTKLETNMIAIKNARLYRLLNGVYNSKDEFNMDNSEIGLHLEFDNITIINVLLNGYDKNRFAEDITTALNSYILYYCTVGTRSEQIIFILNSPDRDQAIQLANKMLEKAKNDGITLTIGIGSSVSDYGKLGHSFIEASNALDYRFIKGNNTIIDYQEVSKIDTRAYPNNEILALNNALASHNGENIQAALERIIEILESGNIPVYLAKAICSDIIHLIHTYSVDKKDDDMLIKLSNADNVYDVIQFIQLWKKKLMNTQAKEMIKESSMADIQKYIDQNCLKGEFSAYETADRFNLTLPALSKAFKEYSGQNLIDYTTAKRMEKAKELLANTDLSISEISEKVGYYNLSSFTRRFKQSQGVNPSEYRSINDK